VLAFIHRAEELGRVIRSRALPVVLCHGDMHAGNVLVREDGSLSVVDWDEPIFAPRERDRALIGGAFGGSGLTPEEQRAQFMRGYGETPVSREAIAHYRHERIVADIAAFCEQIYRSEDRREDREQAFRWLVSSFDRGGAMELAGGADLP
jgi:spectinomycin phosphotransferase